MNQDNSILIEECFRKARITGELCPNSIVKYGESAKRFLKVIGDKKIEDLELRDFDNFVWLSVEKGNKSTGIKSVLYAMKWIITSLQKEGIIFNKIDFDKIIKPKIKQESVVYLTKEEIGSFLGVIEKELSVSNAIRKLRTMVLYIFLLETGARIGEALSIKIKDIDFNNQEIPIIGKGSKPRTLLFHNQSEKWIKKYLERRKDDCEYLFATLNGKNKWSYNDVCRSFQRYKKLSGIKKDFSIHTFRHTFATQLILNNVSPNNISFLLGHANLETTMKYYIGTIEKVESKKNVQDKHFDFIPEALLVQNF